MKFPINYSNNALDFVKNNALDSITIRNLVKYGNVDFSKSDTKKDSCKVYYIENSYKERDLALKIKNCDSIATVLDINYTNI